LSTSQKSYDFWTISEKSNLNGIHRTEVRNGLSEIPKHIER